MAISPEDFAETSVGYLMNLPHVQSFFIRIMYVLVSMIQMQLGV